MQRGDYTFLPLKLRKSLNDNLVTVMMINFGFHKLQLFLTRKFFLQDSPVIRPKGIKTQKALALENLNFFNILSFLMFFFHVIIGFVSCLTRITAGLWISLISLARIDKNMLPKGYEKQDTGYSAYIGMLMVEVHHRNPVASVFCNELLVSNREKGCANVLLAPVNDNQGNAESISQKISIAVNG
ncbi:Hypothetical predicted protein [Mytilus galloprovincialis]|uniref:Uncharacterized protein n=1 Tax=Mytilus galloprovincialis TaxID=29158 RepID=A0A8B6DHT4_MYTGA|nr:Hypothetical predicted protein [Mytilus galloprovincialis]